ncbi:KAP family P-loop NTPase fold protein [Vogesella mureinivorans]|uniref:KAP family P-loop NTPase fold protein n=1 Tax=Vogesella mureinivorans TaxID=657276 RepID=UPI0011CBC1C0|nr:P-loop NTPase fold protein [Vogesella mureinivorans]
MTDIATDSPQLLTDAPANAEEDLLGFAPHAKRLAALIQKQIPDKASFVIGIEGEWGEGKSSFINCLKAAFPTDDTRPTIVDFNPWWFEGSDQLLRHFFDELLGQIDWTRGDGQKLFDSFSKLAAFAGRVGKLMQTATEPMLQTAGKVAEGVGQAFGGGSKPESFRKLREDAAATLSALSFKTIVFIDDLDRLPAREIVELFRVIKAVADLPNIVYVIAYDRAIVASALDQVHEGRGEAYLEKIIQYSYSLPRPHAKQKLAYNKKVIAQYLTDLPGGIDYHGVSRIVEAFLPVPRSVKRLSAALLDYRLGVQDGMEMDALDYLFLEAVRHFDMGVYNELARAIFFSHEYCQLNPAHSLSGEETPSTRLAWVRERFEYTLKKHAHHPEVLDAIHFFTGFVFSEKQENARAHGYRTMGSKLLTYIVSKRRNPAGRKGWVITSGHT